MAKLADLIESKQKRLYSAVVVGAVLAIGGIIFFTQEAKPQREGAVQNAFDIPSNDIKPENIRLTQIEKVNDVLGERLQSLEKSVIDLKEENTLIEAEKLQLSQETQALQRKLRAVEEEVQLRAISHDYGAFEVSDSNGEAPLHQLKVWEADEKPTDRSILFEIPAGTVVKAVLVSGADCSVAVQKPTGPNMMLLRPLDDGKLPRGVRVALKGSVIIGNAIGDIASERVYVRAERMTLVERNGSFVETEISAYISGEDGREGLRGVVVDRSGQIITRAAFAAFLQGVNESLQATLNNQTIEKLAEVNHPGRTILDVDTFRNAAFQGGSTGLAKLSEYYIKRAEQLQPAIQVAAGRVVDVIFTKTVRVGENDLKKRLDNERNTKMKELRHA